MSIGQEMEGSMVLLVLLFLTIPSLNAFSLKKMHSPLFQPNPFLGHRDVAEKNVLRQPRTIEVRIRQPILRPLSYQDFDEKNEDGGLQNKAKKPESIRVEIKEPILRLFSYQDFAGRNRNLGLQNKAKKPRVEISEPIVWPLNKQDFDRQLEEDVGMQTEAKNPGLIGVEIREPIVRPLSYQDFDEKYEDGGLQNKAKKPESIGVEIKEPILRLFSYQDFAGRHRNLGLQNKAKKLRVEITEPIVRPLNKEDFDRQLEEDVGMQTKAKNPGLIGVEIREPIVRPFSYQDFAEKNEDLKERISFIISRFLEDMGLQNIPKDPESKVLRFENQLYSQ